MKRQHIKSGTTKIYRAALDRIAAISEHSKLAPLTQDHANHHLIMIHDVVTQAIAKAEDLADSG